MYHRRKFVWTPRRAAAGIFVALLFAFVASWTSLPARAGGSAPSIAVAAPRHMLAVRTGIVYPLNLPRPSAQASFARHSRSRRIANPFAYAQREAAVANDAMLPELPSLATLALTDTPTASTGFAGLAFPNSQCGPGCEPPSMGVAAGPSNVVEVTNIVGRIFDKSGNDLSDFNLNTFFGVATAIFSSDPRIEYDTLSQRWFISFLTFDTDDISTAQNGFWNLAVSSSSDPTQKFYTYQVETMGDFPDQPPLGFNDDKVVTGGNSFSCTVSTPDPGNPNCTNGDYEGNEFLIWNKSELLAGATSIDTDYYPPDEDSSDFPIIPAKSRTSTSTLWMLSACVNTFSECNDSLNLWSVIDVPGVNSGSSASLSTLAISEIDPPPVAPQKGNSSNPIDTGDGRLLDAAFRDGLLWASGNASCTPPSDTIARSCLQYIEVQTGTSPTVGRDFPFGTKGAYDYYPSIDLDSADDLITSFTQSSGAEYPSAYVDGRLATEVNNVLGTPVPLEPAGTTTTYNSPNPESFNSNAFPWGDYSGAGIDPTDQTAVWVAGEYSASVPTPLATPNWGTWIAEARVISPSPTPTSTGSPTPTATATSTATGSSTASATTTPTASATATATSTSTASGSPTTSASATPTASGSPTTSASATPTATATATPTSTTSGSPTVSATPTASTTATATLTPTATATATSTATATASATQTITPTATATATPVGTLSVSGSLSFGKVKVNATKSKKLKVKNKGKFPLQVIIGDTLKPPFSVPDIGIFTLGKKKTLTVTVLFKPTVAGPTPLQILSITSNDPHHPAHPENATGSGK